MYIWFSYVIISVKTEHLRNIEKVEKQLVYIRGGNALGVERDENEFVYIFNIMVVHIGLKEKEDKEEEKVGLGFGSKSCIFVIEIARHFDITAIFNLHAPK